MQNKKLDYSCKNCMYGIEITLGRYQCNNGNSDSYKNILPEDFSCNLYCYKLSYENNKN